MPMYKNTPNNTAIGSFFKISAINTDKPTSADVIKALTRCSAIDSKFHHIISPTKSTLILMHHHCVYVYAQISNQTRFILSK